VRADGTTPRESIRFAAVEEQVYQELYELEDEHWWFRGRRAVIRALLDRAPLPERPRILDAGCGTGRNLVELGALGDARGVDPSPDAIAFCRRRGLGAVTEAGIESLPFPDGSFDLVVATDVIEHIEDDAGALAELGRVAAGGGFLLLTVPAYMWLWSQHDDSHHHRRRYTLRMLRDRVQAAGWRPTAESYFNTTLLGPIAAVRTLTRRRSGSRGRSDYQLTEGPLNTVLSLPMRGEAALIRRGAHLPAGVSIGMLCQRAQP
jgi:SAM-dependent methyltransferase